eukprot:CAMPEP_0119387970 /NCGR_PEP_ID=MMETSP1334-20130426/102927_1 /TAXON_ID=127549 /ORGANISM="Calcidiscus leptoporus, Strain RCC1130" /LENGTH=87 /DNA_ID=CAMNT_0007409827 /DNA_START=12 /DNA_END=272 /DNA_ORIENTATION=+
MPASLSTKVPHSELDKAPPQRTGRRLGLHNDAGAYGDVIVTVTLFGHVQILLRNDKERVTAILGLERGQGTDAGEVGIHEGDAYALW